jgi:hypothetical protein
MTIRIGRYDGLKTAGAAVVALGIAAAMVDMTLGLAGWSKPTLIQIGDYLNG